MSSSDSSSDSSFFSSFFSSSLVSSAAPPPPPQVSSAAVLKKYCTAMYAYEATHPTQLDMAPGEEFMVLKEDLPGGWTQVQNSMQKEGTVPTSYLKIGTAPVPESALYASPQQPLQAPPPP